MDAYKKELQDALLYMEQLKFDKQHPWHRNLIALYCSLIEYSDSLIFLIAHKKFISVPVVFRGLLEAYIDFKNLSADSNYGNYMEAAYSKEVLKLLEEATQKDNSFLESIANDNDMLQIQISEHRKNITRLKSNGYKPLKQFQKFNKASMKQEYKSIYTDVCSHSHNNISALIDRFFIINEDENDFEIVLFREYEQQEFDRYLKIGQHYLRNASHTIHTILKTGYETKFPE